MAKLTGDTKKIFALSSTIGAVLMSHQDGEPKLIAMRVQIDKAMKVFSRKVGPKMYWAISNEVQRLWTRVAEKHNNTVDEDELPLFIEYLCTLAPASHFKKFLGLSPYRSRVDMRPEIKVEVVKSVLELDEQFNKLFGTKPYVMAVRKPVVVKPKTERDKSKKEITNEKKVSKTKLKRAYSNERRRAFFKKLREQRKARENDET